MSNFDFICVSGYGRSGSSACVDLLKEFEYIDGPDREFRIVKDPCGLLDLELSIVDNWEFIRHNTAINEFLKYCAMLSRKDGILKRVGKNFSELLYVDFLKESEDYIDRISNFTYVGDTMLNRYHLNSLQSFNQRLKSKFGLTNAVPMYFSRPSEGKFLMETRVYLRKIFKNYSLNNNVYKIVLDQAISPTNIDKTLRYFDSVNMVIVDRDPRDIYATMVNEKRFLGLDNLDRNTVYKYIEWHKCVRKRVTQDVDRHTLENNILRVKFEDLFYHYDRTIGQIVDFLDIANFEHSNKGSRFNPGKIHHHVGTWKKILDKNDALLIEEELREYCYS